MSDMMTPLQWHDQPDANSATAAWPLPAGGYAPAVEADGLVACVIVGLNDSRMKGRLKGFLPEQATAQVQMPSSRATLPLHFAQFRSLAVTTPLARVADARDAATTDGLTTVPPVGAYAVRLANGETLHGATLGHVETAFGLFLFPVQASDGSVQRIFYPRTAYADWTVDGAQGTGADAAHDSAGDGRRDGPRDSSNDDGTRGRDAGRDSTDAGHAGRVAASAAQKPGAEATTDILSIGLARTPAELLAAIDRQSNMPMVRIGEALMSLGLVTQQQLLAGLERQAEDRSVPLGEVLVRMNAVSRDDLRVALAHKMGYPIVNLDEFACDPRALGILPHATAQRLQIMPLLLDNGRLIVALEDPAGRRAAIDELEFSSQTKVVPVLAQCHAFAQALYAAYDRVGQAGDGARAGEAGQGRDTPNTGELVETLEREGLDLAGGGADDERPIEQSDNSLVRLINSIIIEAHTAGVSDVHIESCPGREKTKVRFRKDGRMSMHLELPHNYRSALIARIKIMCDLDIAERRKPQDGKIAFAKFSPQHRIELRVATIPTNGGLEDVVMRILASAKPLPVSKLGLSPKNLTGLTGAVERPYGLVLCVGPTGSGKTTTLHSVLSHINVPERKIWTAEDPIEITQAGLRQVQVNPKIDWTFAKALRAFLRADPDAIMVGEIRDNETAHMAVEASLTGHLVLSTLHTNSAPETVTRLLDMGLDPFNFADSLLAVLAQRLVRRLCTACRTAEPATPGQVDELLQDHLHAYGAAERRPSADSVLDDWIARFGSDGRLMRHHSPGCKQCEHTGHKGRAGMHELMLVGRELRHLVQTSARAEELQASAMAAGMRTLRQDGIEKVWAGVTSIEEVRATSNG